MKKTFAFLAIAIFSAVAGYSISHGGPVLVPSLMNFGANGSVTPTVGDCLNILAFGTSGTTATDAGTPCNLPPSTIAALPTCNAALEGARGTVTNGQTTPTFLGAVSTTGAVVAPVFCNGAAWVYGG
jgi:hypothetical protein